MTLPEKMSNGQLQTQSEVKSVASVLKSGEPSLITLSKNGFANEMITQFTLHALKFIRLNFPGTQNMPDVAADFSKNLISQRPDWKQDDVELFFKYISCNPLELSFTGNIITPIRLMDLTSIYENERSNEREIILSEFKNSIVEKEEPSDESKKEIKKITEKIKFLKEKPRAIVNNFTFFDPVKNEADREKLLLNIPGYSDEMLRDIYSSYYTSLHPQFENEEKKEFNVIVEIILKAIKNEIAKRKLLQDTEIEK